MPTQDALRSLARLFDNKLCREQQVREKAPDFDVQELIHYLPSPSQRASWNDPCSAGTRVCIEKVKKWIALEISTILGWKTHGITLIRNSVMHHIQLDVTASKGLETWNPLPLGATWSISDTARSAKDAKVGTQYSVSPFLSWVNDARRNRFLRPLLS